MSDRMPKRMSEFMSGCNMPGRIPEYILCGEFMSENMLDRMSVFVDHSTKEFFFNDDKP